MNETQLIRVRDQVPKNDEDSDDQKEKQERQAIFNLNDPLAFMNNAPPDAFGCSKIQTLSAYVKGL